MRFQSQLWSHYGMLFLQPPVMTLVEKRSLQAAAVLAWIHERVNRYLTQTHLLTRRDLWYCCPPTSWIILWPEVFTRASFHQSMAPGLFQLQGLSQGWGVWNICWEPFGLMGIGASFHTGKLRQEERGRTYPHLTKHSLN